ncbi:MAG: hypothetical protein QM760_16700 [Nibricoccus sp.]
MPTIPERTLERGYALAEAEDGEPLTSARTASAAGRFSLRFADGSIRVAADPPPTDAEAPEEKLFSTMSPDEQEPTTTAHFLGYEAAVERLEEIIDRLDSGRGRPARDPRPLQRGPRAGRLQPRRRSLDAVGEGLKELNLDDLAARLDSSAGSGA